ncbi:MAG: hypothetical protein LBI59_10190 [Candidatus Accumulibacter sp.]|nr:hypothetical protein [Accumulibacter sp.]
MRLDRIELALRRRSPWEAIDLGLIMVRQWRGPLYRVWLAVVLPVALVILAALWEWPRVGMVVVWWLKPVADRILLKLFSEATFGEPPALREIWRSIPALLRGNGLFSSLTFRRFSPYRSFVLPMLQLEGQRGKALRLRDRTLSRKVAGYAFWLMFVCFHLVIIFEIGLVQLAGFLIPGDAPSGFSLFSEEEAGLLGLYLINAAWFVAESIVEPFYVAAGFSLYLNRRSELEGWDIEVAFRHMAEVRADVASPARSRRRRGAAAGAVMLLAGALIVLPVPGASAEEASGENSAAVFGEARRVAQEVLSDPVFGSEAEEMVWRRRAREASKTPDENAQDGWLRRFSTIFDWLAQGMRGVVFVVMAVALAALLIALYRYSGRFARMSPERAARAPDVLFGLDLRASSLPADPAAAAETEVAAGRAAAALSLLYRGALVALIERHHVRFRAGDTENVCRQRAAECAGEGALAYFSALLEAWKASAYAGSPPSLSSVAALCREWREHFAGRGEPA